MTPRKRILVRGPNYLGDHVMALPFYDSLRRGWPEAHLTLLTKENLTELKPVGYDEIISIEPGALRFGLRNLAPRQFEVGITLVSAFSSAMMLFAARIPERVGFSEPLGLPLLNHGRRWKGVTSGRHKRDLYLELLDLLEIPRAKEVPAFDKIDLPDCARERFVVIAPEASIRLREWPYFPELIVGLLSELPDFGVVIVGNQPAKWQEKLPSDRVTNLIGKTTLRELVRISARATLVIANDSGIAHLAASVADTPTLVLFGPGDPQYIRPWGAKVQGLRIDIPCSPCESATCRNETYKRCLNDLELGRVLEAAVTKVRE